MQTHTTPLQYCDNTATPVLRYAAYGDSSGLVTDFTNANDLDASGDINGDAVGAAELASTAIHGLLVCKTLFDSGNLADTDDVPDLWSFNAASTVTDIDCISTGGTSITVTIEDDAGEQQTAVSSYANLPPPTDIICRATGAPLQQLEYSPKQKD